MKKVLFLVLLMACSKEVEHRPFYGEWKKHWVGGKECRTVTFKGTVSEECRDLPSCVDAPPPQCPVIIPRCEECAPCGFKVQGNLTP